MRLQKYWSGLFPAATLAVCVLMLSGSHISAYSSAPEDGQQETMQDMKEVERKCRNIISAIHQGKLDLVQEELKLLYHENSRAAEFLPSLSRRIAPLELMDVRLNEYISSDRLGDKVYTAGYRVVFEEASLMMRFELKKTEKGLYISNLSVKGVENESN